MVLMLFILVYRQQVIKMQGARPNLQSDCASKLQQQKPSLLVVDDDGMPSKSVETPIKQREYPPLMQTKSWTKSAAVGVCKNEIYTHLIAEVQEGGLLV
jgi:hypothetical protein